MMLWEAASRFFQNQHPVNQPGSLALFFPAELELRLILELEVAQVLHSPSIECFNTLLGTIYIYIYILYITLEFGQ